MEKDKSNKGEIIIYQSSKNEVEAKVSFFLISTNKGLELSMLERTR